MGRIVSAKKSRKRTITSLVIVAVLSTITLASFTPKLLAAWDATRWTQCTAVVTESRYERFIHPQFHTCCEKPRFEYSYLIEGKRYWSDKVDASLREKLAEGVSFIDALPVGSEVTIHVDPLDPQNAILKPPANIMATVLGPLLFLGLTAVSWCLRRRPNGGDSRARQATLPTSHAHSAEGVGRSRRRTARAGREYQGDGRLYR